MIKKELLIVIAFLLLPLVAGEITGQVITGEAITGRVSSQTTDVSLMILPDPVINLYSPKNGTYLVNNIPLQYNAFNCDDFYYGFSYFPSISAANGSQTINLNLADGGYNLYFFGNNSRMGQLNASLNLTFSVNTSLYNVIYTEFNGTFEGDSTEFISHQYTYEELQNLSDIVLENDLYGKILFLEPIDVVEDGNVSDRLTDLDEYVQMNLNRIEIDTSGLSNFNKSASIWFYNVGFTNPQILRDGSVCSSSICAQESFSGGTLKLNVTGFSVYSLRETPVTVTVTSGGGGGGGSTTSIANYITNITYDNHDLLTNLSYDEEKIVVDIFLGGNFTLPLDFFNEGEEDMEIELLVEGIGGFTTLSESNIVIVPNSTKTVEIFFSSPDEPRYYTGDLVIKNKGSEVKIPLVFNVRAMAEIEEESPIGSCCLFSICGGWAICWYWWIVIILATIFVIGIIYRVIKK